MKELDLSAAADEFGFIRDDCALFYNKETGEFDWLLGPDHDDLDDDPDRFDGPCWVACPDRWELDDYAIMVDFTQTLTDDHQIDLLLIALDGKGAFRRFFSAISRLGLDDQWQDFHRQAYLRVARRWCDGHGIAYVEAPPDHHD